MSGLHFLLMTFILLVSSSANSATDSLRIQRKAKWKKESSNKGSVYLYWGYNRAWFSRSDIHFSAPDYDLTFYKLKAQDQPTKFTFNNYFNPENITVAQYNFRLGYFVTGNLHLSIGVDHMKYVVQPFQ